MRRSGREHGEALLDPRLKVEQHALLLAEVLVLGAEPHRLAGGLDGVLDQGAVASVFRHSQVATTDSVPRLDGQV